MRIENNAAIEDVPMALYISLCVRRPRERESKTNLVVVDKNIDI